MPPRKQFFLVAVLLATLTLAAYWPVVHHGFISYDDNEYLTDNSYVKAGLCWENVRWAFTTFDAANWHPLTWLSHMLDVQLFGMQAGGHHAISLALHLANTLLLFGLLNRLTGALWRSALVAALFALHPLHVESVAWVAERKDVLSAFFFMLTLWAYLEYAQGSKFKVQSSKADEGRGWWVEGGTTEHATRNTQHALAPPKRSEGGPMARSLGPWPWYCAALVLFALGLMAKPMLVTLPFVLLLLDFWPLRRVSSVKCQVSGQEGPFKVQGSKFKVQGSPSKPRWSGGQWSVVSGLFLEKLPFLTLSLGSCIVTLVAQRRGGTVIELRDYGIWERLCNSTSAYLKYLWKTIWPTDLTLFYPHPFIDASARWPTWECVAAAVILAGVSALAILRFRRHPWFAIGWFWFLGMLVPVIGLVQVGSQAMADRYTYLPLIGVFVAVVWAIPEFKVQGSKFKVQSSHPEVRNPKSETQSPNSRGLRTQPVHTTTAATEEPTDHNSLTHSPADSLTPFPAHSLTRAWVTGVSAVGFVLICALLTRRQVNLWQNTETVFENGLKLSDKNAPAHMGLALGMALAGKYGFALAHCRAALQADPSYIPAWQIRGEILGLLGKPQEAVTNYTAALRWKRASPWTWYRLGQIKASLGDTNEAEKDFRASLSYKPDLLACQNSLGALLVARGNRAEALEHFQMAAHLSPKTPEYHFNLGTTYTDSGELARGEAELREAVRLKPDYLQALAALAGVLQQEGKTAEARATLSDLDRLGPATPKAKYDAGTALLSSGLTNEAARAFADALRLEPTLAKDLLEAGKELVAQGKLDQAMAGFLAVVRLQPENADAHERLGLLLVNQAKLQEGIVELKAALKLSQTSPTGPTSLTSLTETRYNLALALAMAGHLPEAVTNYQQVLEIAPNSAATLNDLAWIKATARQPEIRNGPEAVRLAEKACDLKGNKDPGFLGTLAAAYAEAGHYDDAVKTTQKIIELASAAGDKAAVQKAQGRLQLYQARQPFRQ